MAVKYTNRNGPLGGRCPECDGRLRLYWKGKVTAEWECASCGLVLSHAGYRGPQEDVLETIVRDVFDELEARGILRVRLQPFLRVVSAASHQIAEIGVERVTLRQLEKWGLEVELGFIKRRK